MTSSKPSYPVLINFEAGELTKFCSCGLSKELPICDHAHSGTGMKSYKFTPEQNGSAWIAPWTSPPILKPKE